MSVVPLLQCGLGVLLLQFLLLGCKGVDFFILFFKFLKKLVRKTRLIYRVDIFFQFRGGYTILNLNS